MAFWMNCRPVHPGSVHLLLSRQDNVVRPLIVPMSDGRSQWLRAPRLLTQTRGTQYARALQDHQKTGNSRCAESKDYASGVGGGNTRSRHDKSRVSGSSLEKGMTE